jgi:hypothetical protein
MFIFLILFLCLFYGELSPQSNQIKNFYKALIENQTDLTKYVHPESLQKSKRLDINYEGIPNKFLISFDIDESIKERIKNKELSYQLEYEELTDNYQKVTFVINDKNYRREFFFKDDKLVSSTSYFTRKWEKRESQYFRIFLSDPLLFNNYSILDLDNFVNVMLILLNVEQGPKALLEKEKIDYILCKDENEIEKVSGFNTRGIYILAYDEIITTYNCHFHEIAHLLINFKLKNLPLYTLPFFQEGFATAMGGRGGLGRSVLLDVGFFLQKSGFIPFNSILTKTQFLSEDASMTYPVAALYNLFLIEELGITSYLSLYLKYSDSQEGISNLTIDSIKLPPMEKFNAYYDDYGQNEIIFAANETFSILSESNTWKIMESPNYYLIKIRSNLLLKSSDSPEGYISKKFNELFPGIKYDGYKYLIQVNSREINIYNLYTNILIASYSTGFTLDGKEVPAEEGYFIFYLKKDVFGEEIRNLIISDI